MRMAACPSLASPLLPQREGDEPLGHGGAHLGRDAPGRLIYGHVWGVNEPVNCNSGELGRLYMGMYGQYTPPTSMSSSYILLMKAMNA